MYKRVSSCKIVHQNNIPSFPFQGRSATSHQGSCSELQNLATAQHSAQFSAETVNYEQK